MHLHPSEAVTEWMDEDDDDDDADHFNAVVVAKVE